MSHGGADVALGRQEDRLADLGEGLEPVGDDLLGVLVPFGGVEVADPFAVGGAEDPVERGGLADGPLVQQGDLDAGLAQLAGGQDRLVAVRLDVIGARGRTRRSGSRRRRCREAGLEELATVDAGQVRIGHLQSPPNWAVIGCANPARGCSTIVKATPPQPPCPVRESKPDEDFRRSHFATQSPSAQRHRPSNFLVPTLRVGIPSSTLCVVCHAT